MSHTIRLGRWSAELHQRAIYIQQRPDPTCIACRGTGGLDFQWAADTELCDCWDPFRTVRIPLWRKPATDGWPF